MARKKKKRSPKMPPLSFVDKLTYFGIFLIWLAAIAAFFFLPYYLRHVIAFSDETVVASAESASILWTLIPWFTFFFFTMGLWGIPLSNRKPIFGIKGYKYGPPNHPKIYPLFMKNKPPAQKSEKDKKARRMIAIVLLILIVISFLPFPLGLFGRNILHTDGSVEQYNMFNIQTDQFAPEDITSMEIAVDWDIRTSASTRRIWWSHRDWNVRISFEMTNGEIYSFDQGHFRRDVFSEDRYWLVTMLAMKQCFDPQIIRYDGAEHLDRIIDDHSLDQSEIDLLYQLFDQ